MRLYHYTCFIEDIERDQVLLPVNKHNQHTRFFADEKLAVWLTTNEKVDPTSAAAFNKAPISRIEIDGAIKTYTWKQYKKICGAPQKFLRALENEARERGVKLSEWRCTFEAIPAVQWKEIKNYGTVSE